MKRIVLMFSLLSALVFASHASATSSAEDAKAVREFRALGRAIAKSLIQSHLMTYQYGYDINDLAGVVKAAQVVPTHDVLTRSIDESGAKQVDAMNYPAEKKIVLFVPGWKVLSSKDRRALVLHEYLGLIGAEKDVYDESTRLLEELKKLKSAKDPESICSREVYGTHDGSACLWDVQGKAETQVAAAEKRLSQLTASAAHRSTREAFLKLKSTRAKIQETECRVATAGHVGNDAAYLGDLCEANSLRRYLAQLNRLIRSVR